MDYVLGILGPMIDGSLITMKMFAIVIVLSLPLGLLVSLLRISRFKTFAVCCGHLYLGDAGNGR